MTAIASNSGGAGCLEGVERIVYRIEKIALRV